MGPGGGRPLSQALAEDLDTKGKEEVWGNRAPEWLVLILLLVTVSQHF